MSTGLIKDIMSLKHAIYKALSRDIIISGFQPKKDIIRPAKVPKPIYAIMSKNIARLYGCKNKSLNMK